MQTAEDSKYNGFDNWETWNVALWFDNDESLYRAYRGREYTAEEAEELARDLLPNGTPDMDKTDGGYAVVNWYEISEVWNAE